MSDAGFMEAAVDLSRVPDEDLKAELKRRKKASPGEMTQEECYRCQRVGSVLLDGKYVKCWPCDGKGYLEVVKKK